MFKKWVGTYNYSEKWKPNSHQLQINGMESELSNKNVCKIQVIHNYIAFSFTDTYFAHFVDTKGVSYGQTA